jgi:hypothetical protein
MTVNFKTVEGSARCMILRRYPRIGLEDLRKTDKNLSQGSQCLRLALEHTLETSPTEPTWSVRRI